ncbi:hypothetical protein F4820DRAFT_449853 [Hypoxylon rubiginosum]|uniref:Uncharacterized protein n=1 Tax=Hypoxylon rubiginosum TaxID=110542 RepID=A0ACB9YXZ8_9PEZI|nr:hypothetical protein F4820DRAFT_449853 [Hypoxylon rubiginosum]
MVRITFLAILSIALPALAVPVVPVIVPDAAGAIHVGNGNGTQFIGGECEKEADCASTCCAFVIGGNFGVCSGLRATTQAGKAGCGFGTPGATPVSVAAPAPTGSTCSN